MEESASWIFQFLFLSDRVDERPYLLPASSPAESGGGKILEGLALSYHQDWDGD
jgi:hypothetical protein